MDEISDRNAVQKGAAMAIQRKTLLIGTAGVAALLGLGLLLLGGYREESFMDINSGKVKSQYTLWNCPLVVRVNETPYSRLLEQNGFSFPAENWKRTSCHTLFPYGWECSIYGGCVSDAAVFATAMEEVQPFLSPEERLFFLNSQLKRIQNFPEEKGKSEWDTPTGQLMLHPRDAGDVK